MELATLKNPAFYNPSGPTQFVATENQHEMYRNILEFSRLTDHEKGESLTTITNPELRQLIIDLLKHNPAERPTMEEALRRLIQME